MEKKWVLNSQSILASCWTFNPFSTYFIPSSGFASSASASPKPPQANVKHFENNTRPSWIQTDAHFKFNSKFFFKLFAIISHGFLNRQRCAWQARLPWSSWATGAPKRAMTPSPLNWLMVPSNRHFGHCILMLSIWYHMVYFSFIANPFGRVHAPTAAIIHAAGRVRPPPQVGNVY